MIQVLNAVYGGERFVGDGLENIIDLGSHLAGFCLDSTGKLRASNAEISGDIESNNAKFTGRLDANISLRNGVVSPLVGAVRGRYTFGAGSTSTVDWIIVTRISDLPRKYRIDLPNTISTAEKKEFVQRSILQAKASIVPFPSSPGFIIPCETEISYEDVYYEVTFTGTYNNVVFAPNNGIIILIY
jgi:hypothetical protein